MQTSKSTRNPQISLAIAAKIKGMDAEEYAARRTSGQKHCKHCNEWKPADTAHFHRISRASDGLYHVCRKCRSKQRKRYRAKAAQTTATTTAPEPTAEPRAALSFTIVGPVASVPVHTAPLSYYARRVRSNPF